ncbi:EGF-like domain protein [Cooperia oncophora]
MPQQCRDSTDCHENGHCVVVDDNGYVCECLPGYRGDGIRQCVVAVLFAGIDYLRRWLKQTGVVTPLRRW